MYKRSLLALMMGVALALTPVVAQAEELLVDDSPQQEMVEQTDPATEPAATIDAPELTASDPVAEPEPAALEPVAEPEPAAFEPVAEPEPAQANELPAEPTEDPTVPTEATPSVEDATTEPVELPVAEPVEEEAGDVMPDTTSDEHGEVAAAQTEAPADVSAPAAEEGQSLLEMQATAPLKNGSVYSLTPSHATSLKVGATGTAATLATPWLLSDFWKALTQSDGSYWLQHLESGKYLAVSGTPKAGAAVVLAAKATSWLVSLTANENISIAPKDAPKLRLDVKGGGKREGADLQLWNNNGSAAQQFDATVCSALTTAANKGAVVPTGAYVISPASSSKFALDVKSASKADGANIDLWTKNGSLAQAFGLTYVGNGLYTVQAGNSGKLVELKGGSYANGTNIQQATRSNTVQQYWYLIKSGSSYSIRNARTGKVLALAQDKVAKGQNVQQAAVSTSTVRLFNLTPTSFLSNGSIYSFSSTLASALPVSVKGNATAAGTAVQTAKDVAVLGHYWKAVVGSDGMVTLVNLRSGKKLSVAGSVAKKATTQIASGNATTWLLTVNDDATFSVHPSSNPSLVLDVKGGSTKAGADLQLWASNGSKAQKYSFVANAVLNEAAKKGTTVADGIYRIASTSNTKIVAAIKGASVDSGANVQLAKLSSSSMAQKYELASIGYGLYTIKAANSGKLVAVNGGSTSASANVNQQAKGNVLSEYWYLIKDDKGYSIRNAKSGLALEAAGSVASGSNIQLNKAESSANQRFSLVSTPLLANGTYAFSSDLTEYKMLAMTVKGTNAQTAVSNGGKSQKWVLTHVGNGIYTIKNAYTGTFLSVAGSSKTAGANVEVASTSGGKEHQWRLRVSDFGGVIFMNVNSGKVLDIRGSKSNVGVNIQQWGNNGSKAQSFVVKTDAEHAKENVASIRTDLKSASRKKLASFVEKMVLYADILNVGYDMGNRWDVRDGGETDCSALVITCLQEVGLVDQDDIDQGIVTYTGNMSSYLTQRGWKRFNISSSSGLNQLMAGDILLNDELHTCAVIAGMGSTARVAQASIDENGHGWNGKLGDQTGYETNIKQAYWYSSGWDCILRYVG